MALYRVKYSGVYAEQASNLVADMVWSYLSVKINVIKLGITTRTWIEANRCLFPIFDINRSNRFFNFIWSDVFVSYGNNVPEGTLLSRVVIVIANMIHSKNMCTKAVPITRAYYMQRTLFDSVLKRTNTETTNNPPKRGCKEDSSNLYIEIKCWSTLLFMLI